MKTEQDSLDSLYLLNDLVTFGRPQYIGIPLSDAEFDAKYAEYTKGLEFREDMKKLEFLLLTKKDQEITNFKGTKTGRLQ